MSSKGSRKTTSTSSTRTHSKTSSSVSGESQSKTLSTPASSSIPIINSPVSPTRLSRLQERNELQNLNDRLANYIDSIKHLEAENTQLCHQIEVAEETVTRETTGFRFYYEKELDELRKTLDAANKAKAACSLQASRYADELAELRAK